MTFMAEKAESVRSGICAFGKGMQADDCELLVKKGIMSS
jgi:hypothetical protein